MTWKIETLADNEIAQKNIPDNRVIKNPIPKDHAVCSCNRVRPYDMMFLISSLPNETREYVCDVCYMKLERELGPVALATYLGASSEIIRAAQKQERYLTNVVKKNYLQRSEK